MSTDYLSGTTLSDHDITLAIPGDVASVRVRLIAALQELGYKILGEQPLRARRRSQGVACYECSLNVLDYPTTVTISLKQTNNVAVLATFSYEIKSYMRMTKGDRQTLAREAEAMAAFATERLAITACRACGTQFNDESQFCRRCGAPLVLDLPELEVLRLTRGARGAYHNIFVGVISSILALLVLIVPFVLAGWRLLAIPVWIAIALGAYGLFLLATGNWQLHRMLNQKNQNTATGSTQPTFVSSSVTTALPPAPVHASVTEATTDLLSPVNNRRPLEPVQRKNGDTAEMDPERLM